MLPIVTTDPPETQDFIWRMNQGFLELAPPRVMRVPWPWRKEPNWRLGDAGHTPEPTTLNSMQGGIITWAEGIVHSHRPNHLHSRPLLAFGGITWRGAV